MCIANASCIPVLLRHTSTYPCFAETCIYISLFCLDTHLHIYTMGLFHEHLSLVRETSVISADPTLIIDVMV